MSMKKRANGWLAIITLAFAGAAACRFLFPAQWWPQLLLYITEAGLVGALADLFAVTALFRHPFGWKWIPHTAIIPKSRDKLVNGVVTMVEQELLGKHMLKQKLQQYHLVELAIAFIERKAGAAYVEETVWKLLAGMLAKLDCDGIAVKLDKQARSGLQRINAAPYLGKALQLALEHGDLPGWLDKLVQHAEDAIAGSETKRAIRDMLAHEITAFSQKGNALTKWFKKQVYHLLEAADAIDVDDAAAIIYEDLRQFLRELLDPHDELRLLLADMLDKLANDLQHRTDVGQAVEEWKKDVLERISLLPTISASLQRMMRIFTQNAESAQSGEAHGVASDDTLKAWLLGFSQSYWQRFKTEQNQKDWLERYVQEFAGKIIESEHVLIGQIVRQTLEQFTEERLVEFIESKVDTDLQRIRLNGTGLGACAGAVFYLLLYGVYQPLLDLLARTH